MPIFLSDCAVQHKLKLTGRYMPSVSGQEEQRGTMNKENPFLNVDVTKLFSEFCLLEVESDSLVTSQRNNIKAATVVGQLAFEGMQSLAKRQAELAKSSYESYTKGANAVIEADTPEKKASKQIDLVESLFEGAISNLNELTDLTRKSANTIFHVVEQRFSEGLDEFRSVIQTPVSTAEKSTTAKPTPGKAPQKS